VKGQVVPDTVATVLPLLPIPDGVVLPEMVITIALESEEARVAADAAGDGRLLLVPRVGGRYARVGVVGSIENRGRLPNGTAALTVRALERARVGVGAVGDRPGLWVEAEALTDPEPTDEHHHLAAAYRAAAGALLDKIGGRRLAGALAEIAGPGALADSIGYWPDLTLGQRVELLETIDVAERLRLATAWVKEALAELALREKIQAEVTTDLEQGQREAILRRQLAAIRAELGEGDDDVIGEYRRRLAADSLPDTVVTAVSKELDRLERTGGESMEANWIRTWLDTVFELPWGARRSERLDLTEARRILDADHTGLDEVKDRLIEHLAVRKLRAERGVTDAPGDRRRGVILALVGPPGVGKTSLGESVAAALDRSFVRLALGGIRATR
jgi:ATP-dependent Lon protease